MKTIAGALASVGSGLKSLKPVLLLLFGLPLCFLLRFLLFLDSQGSCTTPSGRIEEHTVRSNGLLELVELPSDLVQDSGDGDSRTKVPPAQEIAPSGGQ